MAISEIEAQRELQVALTATCAAAFGGHFSKIGAGRIEIHAAPAAATPIGVIDKVEGFGTELETALFIDGKGFEEAKIPVLESGLVDDVANPLSIECARRGRRKHGSVKPKPVGGKVPEDFW